MSDVTIIDTVETAETNLGNKIDGLSGTIEGLPQEVQEQLNAFKTTIDELKKNVEDTLADVQETVENSPAGIPAPPLASMSAQSTENGIEVTYQAALLFGRSSNNFVVEDQDNLDQIFSVTKGVMIRYSNESYPLTPKDGNLAIIDEDIFTLNADTGVKTAKQKTYEIVGLTNNETYYISAFPYNSNYAYQEAAGLNHKNRGKCQWTGTKGTLTVNVTQDYDYKSLGEYTATMTPTAGGQAITKTQSGPATVVFSGLEAGEYTLSFSAPQYFTAPQSQSVTVVAGQSQTVDVVYEMLKNISDYSWDDILEITKSGGAEKVFEYGGKKQTLVATITGNASDGYTIGETNQVDVTLIGTNNHGENTITLATVSENSSVSILDLNEYPYLYSSTKLKEFLENNYQQILPEIYQFIKTSNVTTRVVSGDNSDSISHRTFYNDSFNAKLFPMPENTNVDYQYLTDNSRYNFDGKNSSWIGCGTSYNYWGSTTVKTHNAFYGGYYNTNNNDVQVNKAYRISLLFCIG